MMKIKRSPRPMPPLIAFLISLFIIAVTGAFGSQPAQSESGILENNKADTVHIPNSTREKAVEPVRIKNSRTKDMADSVILPNSDETAVEQVQNPAFISRKPVLVASHERVKSKGKIIAGAALFGASYGISLVVATFMNANGNSADSQMGSYYYIPVFGPAIVGVKNYSADNGLPATMLFFGWSIAEGMGLTLLITGLVGTPAKAQMSIVPFSIEPLVMKDRTGLIMRMRF